MDIDDILKKIKDNKDVTLPDSYKEDDDKKQYITEGADLSKSYELFQRKKTNPSDE